MSLAFLQSEPTRDLHKIAEDLKVYDTDFDIAVYESMSARHVSKEIDSVKNRLEELKKGSVYGSWLNESSYVHDRLLLDALNILEEQKYELEENEVLVPGFTYYRDVMQFGNYVVGQRCHYLSEGREPAWLEFSDTLPVLKAIEVMRFGSDDDFRQIYMEMADGRNDAIFNVTLEHLTESSPLALAEIDAYCDEKWDGPWPWQMSAPFKLSTIIEDAKEMRLQQVNELRADFDQLIRKLNEADQSQFDLMTAVNEMAGKVDSMIGDIGKLASSSIEVTAGATALGNQNDLHQEIQQPIQQAAEALTQLKSVIYSFAQGMGTGDPAAPDPMAAGGADPAMDPAGGLDPAMDPAAAAGAPPQDPTDANADDVGDELADVSLSGGDKERPMKEV